MTRPRFCRVCGTALAPPLLSAIRRAEMFGWFFPSRCERCQQMAPLRIARGWVNRERVNAKRREAGLLR